MTGFVAYYRVSTDRQGQSGLGLEAQRQRVQEHVQRQGGQVVAGFKDKVALQADVLYR